MTTENESKVSEIGIAAGKTVGNQILKKRKYKKRKFKKIKLAKAVKVDKPVKAEKNGEEWRHKPRNSPMKKFNELKRMVQVIHVTAQTPERLMIEVNKRIDEIPIYWRVESVQIFFDQYTGQKMAFIVVRQISI